jgi:hypothetical protein
MSKEIRGRNVAAAAVAFGLLVSVLSLAAQTTGETFTAAATVKTQTAGAKAKVTIKIDRFLTDAERDKLAVVVKGNDQVATQKALAAMGDVGYIEVGPTRTPLKYAYARSTGGGRMVTVATATPILHLGGTLPDAKPKEGYNLALALLVLDATDAGTGELAPAAKVKVNESGALVTEDYGSEVVRLTGIAKVKPGGTGTR